MHGYKTRGAKRLHSKIPSHDRTREASNLKINISKFKLAFATLYPPSVSFLYYIQPLCYSPANEKIDHVYALADFSSETIKPGAGDLTGKSYLPVLMLCKDQSRQS